MKKVLLFSLLAVSLYSCKKTNTDDTIAQDNIPAATLAKIASLGFGTSNVQSAEGGYLVEGDILLTDALLNSTPTQSLLRIANNEQYRTTNLVNVGTSRVITVLVSNLGSAYISGTDLAIQRYNALGLKMTFQRITSGTPDITIIGFNQRARGGSITLGSSGFPSGGNPYYQVKMNTNDQAYGTNPDVNYVGSVMQHELGHCIGMRHTDYMDRSYSCGGSYSNEGASTVGAILIPGTPSGPDAGSWMLACTSSGLNRTFNSNDIVGLNYLYK